MHQILFLALTYGELELHGLEYHHQIKKNTGKKIKSAALFLHVGSVSVHVSSAPGTDLLLCVKLVVYTLCWPLNSAAAPYCVYVASVESLSV